MSSANLATSEIKRFLASPDPEVLCLSGEWGVGKTYTWEKLLGEASKQKSTALKRYSYVSLFGQTSLEILKQSIFENTEFLVDTDEEFKAQAKSLANTALGGLKKGRSLLAAVPYVQPSLEKVISASNAALFSTVRGQIVCIDDIERRGSGLRVKDVMGLASFLKEQRHCKIVILLNDKELDDEESDFIVQTEKVIDSYVRFAPTSSESCSIALDLGDLHCQEIARRCVQLDIANIRIIRRIHRLSRMVLPAFEATQGDLKSQAIQSIALLAWAHLDRKKSPELAFIRRGGSNRLFADRNSEPLTEEESRWSNLLKNYEFRGMDELDEELQRGVENGFFDIDKIEAMIEKKESEHEKGEGDRLLWQAWDLVKHTFKDNTDEIVATMLSALQASGRISIANINSAIVFTRSLKRESEADQMVIAVTSRDAAPEYWNYKKSPFSHEITDEKLKEALDKKILETASAPSIEKILLEIGTREGWSEENLEALANAPPHEIELLLRSAEESVLINSLMD